MKKKVKQYAQQIQVGELDRRNVLKEFSRVLDNQVCDMFTHVGSKMSMKSCLCICILFIGTYGTSF